MTDNIIITEQVLENMPNKENLLSHENDNYFRTLYNEIMEPMATWFANEE